MAQLRRAILFVKDLEPMLAFYRDGLGLAPVRREEGWIELDGLGLHAIPPHIAEKIDTATPRTETAIKLAFAVGDLDAARARLIAHGARMEAPSSWGSCDGVDPEGNVFQIVK